MFWGSGTSSTDVGNVESNTGLWRACVSIGDERICSNLRSTCSGLSGDDLGFCSKMLASRAFLTIACIISGLSALCLIAYALISTDSNQAITLLSKIIPLVSFVAGLIGIAVGIAFITDPLLKFKLSAAAIVGIIAVVINAIGAIFAFMIQLTT